MCRFRSRRLWKMPPCPPSSRYLRRPKRFAANKITRKVRRFHMALKTYGTMGVDWEERVDYDRLRRERLARVKSMLAKSEMGALLCFDMNNVRYITATHIGSWA